MKYRDRVIQHSRLTANDITITDLEMYARGRKLPLAMIQAFEKYEGREQHQESQWASALYWCSAEKLRGISKQLTAKCEVQRASHSVKEDPYILEWKHRHRSKVMM